MSPERGGSGGGSHILRGQLYAFKFVNLQQEQSEPCGAEEQIKVGRFRS